MKIEMLRTIIETAMSTPDYNVLVVMPDDQMCRSVTMMFDLLPWEMRHNMEWSVNHCTLRFHNNSVIYFKLDNSEKIKGVRYNIAFINDTLQMAVGAYIHLKSRCIEMVEYEQ